MSVSVHFSETEMFSTASGTRPDVVPLDNEIHPLFKRQNFRRSDFRNGLASFYNQHPDWDENADVLDLAVYKRIEPALRLASLLLLRSLPFYTKILCSGTYLSEVSGNIIYDDSFEPSDPQLQATLNELLHLARHTRFYLSDFDTSVSDYPNDKILLGRTRAALLPALFHYSSPQVKICIGLSHFFLKLFSSDYDSEPFLGFNMNVDNSRLLSSSQRTHALFLLANTIAHEMAHSLFQWRKMWELAYNCDPTIPRMTYNNCPEAEPHFSYTDSDNNLGRAWELWLWGALVKAINASLNTSVPVGFYFLRWEEDFEDPSVGVQKVKKALAWNLKMENVEQLFSRKLWEGQFGKGEQGVANTPMRTLVQGVERTESLIEEWFTKRLSGAGQGQSTTKRAPGVRRAFGAPSTPAAVNSRL